MRTGKNPVIDLKPVYVINGFLDSGKTEFFRYTIEQPYFRMKGRTLLLLCEEGENSYSDKLLKKTNTILVKIEKEEDLVPEKMLALDEQYHPDRVLIEYNGMWNFKNFVLPQIWTLEQQITTIDASSFQMYFTNMKSLLAEQIRNSELILFNRCDKREDLASFKRNVKAMFYLDALEHLDRYAGKRIRFTAMVLKPKDFPKNHFVPGRMAMTCCAQDMQFLGFVTEYEKADELVNKEWVLLTARVGRGHSEAYGGEGPMLFAESVKKVQQPKNPVIDFSQPV